MRRHWPGRYSDHRHGDRRHHHHHHHRFHFGYPYFSAFLYYPFHRFHYAGYYPYYGGYYDYGYYPAGSYGTGVLYDYSTTQNYGVDVYGLDDAGASAGSAGSTPPAPGSPATPEEDGALAAALTEGQKAFADGKFADASRHFSEAMLMDDEDGTAKLLFGLSSLGEGGFELAGLALRRALMTTPELIDNPLDLRVVYSSGDSDLADDGEFRRHIAALEAYIDSARARPSDRADLFNARLLLGYLHFGWGQPKEALGIFQDLVLIDANDALAVRLRDSAEAITKQIEAGG